MIAVPRVSEAEAEEIARTHFGVNGSARRLATEHDDAFLLAAPAGTRRLLKISLTDEADGPVSFQTAILLYLASAAPGLPVQRVTTARDGAPEVRITHAGSPRLIRMTSWLDGDLLGRDVTTPALRRDLGTTLARLSTALRGLRHPGAHRTHQWDLQNFGRLRALLDELPADALLPEVAGALAAQPTALAADPPAGARGLRAALTDCLDEFDAQVRPALAATRKQVIHTDFHGENLLTDRRRITGILDFGDALAGPVAMDVGIAACYQLGTGPDLLTPALDVVAGYHAADPLRPADLDLAARFLTARVATRIIVSQWNAQREPANRGYLLRRTPQAIGHFAALRQHTPDEIARTLRAACSEVHQ
ncbi:MAG TPA: phosphotransferase [Trebonia sp.]